MGRRVICLVALAIAVASCVRLALAAGDGADAAPPLDPASEAPAAVPPPMEKLPAPDPLPAPADEVAPATPKNSKANAPKPPGKTPAIAPAASAAAPAATVDPMATKVGGGVPPLEKTPTGDLDNDVQRSQNRAQPPARGAAGGGGGGGGGFTENNPLPPARVLSDRPTTRVAAATTGTERFVVQPDRIPMGRQALGLSVEVKGPPTVNLNKEATYRIVVSNTGTSEATDVVVRDELPEGMELISSQPKEQRGPDSLLVWKLSTVPAGSEQVITLRVRPTKVGQFDHAATVTALASAKSRTRVYQPRLRVEQVATPEKVLKGRPVEFRISVTNVGDGPARAPLVLAKLSGGLKGDAGDPSADNMYELDLREDLPNGVLAPNQRIDLEPLVVDTIQTGEQTCLVRVTSPDVQPGAPEAERSCAVSVIAPQLKLELKSSSHRFTETINPYTITIENPGTAPARNVRVAAMLPLGGKLIDVSSGGKFDPTSRKVTWGPFQLEPGEKGNLPLSFQVRLGGPGVYKVDVEAKADGPLAQRAQTTTQVEGLADLDVDLSRQKAFVDVNGENVFTIKIRNTGSKDAERILVSARHSDNITIVEAHVPDDRAPVTNPEKPTEFVFPQYDRLPVGRTLTLQVRVKAVKTGQASCHVFVMHGDVKEYIEDSKYFRITSPAQ